MRVISYMPVWLFATVLLIISTPAAGQGVISAAFGPPTLPVYEQPICPGEGYMRVAGILGVGRRL